jgi:aspartate carbamoyltransferase catalytic subunit
MERTQLTTTANLTREEVDFLMEESEALRETRTEDLKGLIVASLFYEPSTRTRLSFESAAYRLGASVISVADAASSSMKKGETLEDTIRMADKYADILVMRHPQAGAAEIAIKETEKPFINAGDGSNQHPTQALLDIYTIQREMRQIDGLTIGFAGDMKYARTVHSLLYILRLYKIQKIYFITPEKLRMPQEYLDMLTEAGIPFEEATDLGAKIPELDIIYMTRVQQERFDDINEYNALKDSYILNREMVKTGKLSMKVLHPLPRVNEIATDVDDSQAAAYFRQAENGIYMRMALLKTFAKNYYPR